ncbi:DUF4113 domain-containing protein [Flavobacterium sp. DSR3-2]
MHKNSIQSDQYSINNKIQPKHEKLSPCFTTKIKEIISIQL